MLEKAVSQTVSIKLRDCSQENYCLYDMIDRKLLSYEKDENGITFNVDMPAPGGKIIAVLDQKLSKIEIQAPKTMTTQSPQQHIDILIKDSDSRFLRGMTPVQVQITDPKGNTSEFSDYYAAKSGRLSIDFTPALNDIKGTWTITATELLSGKTARNKFKLK